MVYWSGHGLKKKSVTEPEIVIKPEPKETKVFIDPGHGGSDPGAVFGSVEEIARLVEETGCGFCIDFAHVLARYGEHRFELLENSFKQKKWHCHFSGIEWGEKGEKKHIDTTPKNWKDLFKGLPKGKDIVIISEAPNPGGDAVEGLEIYNKLE